MACDVLSRVVKWHVMFCPGVAKWHVMFCPGWQSGMRCFVKGGKAACDVLSRVAKWHVMFVQDGKIAWMFCQVWQSCM